MRHVGNAVPPLLARAIRDHIGRDLLSVRSSVIDNSNASAPPRAQGVENPTELRSRIMRAVPAKNTSVEVELRKLLWAAGLRGYRLHDDRVPGHPDVIFAPARVAVFVDGCFWHGCAKCYRAPKSNQKYWQMKVERNRERDARVNATCAEQRWHVVRAWEHEIKKSPRLVTRRILAAIKRGLSDNALKQDSRSASLSGRRNVSSKPGKTANGEARRAALTRR